MKSEYIPESKNEGIEGSTNEGIEGSTGAFWNGGPSSRSLSLSLKNDYKIVIINTIYNINY